MKQNRKRLPKHMEMTLREFKKTKRKQFNDVCNFIEKADLLQGSVYLPEKQFYKLLRAVHMIIQTKKELQQWWEKA